MARPDKAAAVAELADMFRGSSAVLLTEYRGLSVSKLKDLRRSLSGTATYAVAKNTLASIAAREAGVGDLAEHLTGPIALTFVSGEPPVAAKALKDFAKANPQLVIREVSSTAGSSRPTTSSSLPSSNPATCCSPRPPEPSRPRCSRPRTSSPHPPPRPCAPSRPCARSRLPRPERSHTTTPLLA